MIINSQFHDYYDYIAKHGRDPKLVYNRNTEAINTRWGNEELSVKFKELVKKDTRFEAIVRALNTVATELQKSIIDDSREDKRVINNGCVYLTIMHSRAFMHAEFNSYAQDWHKSTVKDMHIPIVEVTEERLSDLQKRIALKKNIIFPPADLSVLNREAFIYFTRTLGCPLMVYRYDIKYANTVIYCNPRLSEYSDKVPAPIVWNEITSFLSSADPEPIPQSDLSKLTSHGFDNTSFKREKGGPTRKRKKHNYVS